MFNNSLRDAVYFRIAGVPKLYGASARGRSLLLSESFIFTKIEDSTLNRLHHSGRYLAMAYALGAPEWDGSFPEFCLSEETETASPEVLKALTCKKLLVIAPGAAYGEAKRWPAENFRKVCEFWIKNTAGKVVVVGTSAEAAAAGEVTDSLPDNKYFNLAGKTDMSDIMNILRHADMCVANDSGIMHISAILGGRGVAIFGSTDPTSTSPVSRKWNIMFEKQDCAPCFSRKCPFGTYKCLKSITAEMVTDKIKEIL
jgi:heptosyltransferase-2